MIIWYEMALQKICVSLPVTLLQRHVKAGIGHAARDKHALFQEGSIGHSAEHLEESSSFFEFTICLSRACLGKMIILV